MIASATSKAPASPAARFFPRKISAVIRNRRLLALIGLAAAFFFRLGFGLCSPFWTDTQDEKQIYLIGMKFYTTGFWPWFGPDVTNFSQLPGALQGILAGGPFYLLPVPEAPFILVNILSFGAICFMAWYFSRRLPDISRPLIFAWLLTTSWTLNLSTNVYNPSYVLIGSALFFVSLLETYPFLAINILATRWSNLMMGFSLFWIMQLHMSWVVLVPFIALSFYFQFRSQGRRVFVSLMWFGLGAVVVAWLLIPTYWRYGSSGGTLSNVGFNPANLPSLRNIFESIPGRFLSLASFEVPRFIGAHTQERLTFLKSNLWLAPFAIILTVVGILQPASLIFLWFRSWRHPYWREIKYLTLGTVVVLQLAFLFTTKQPVSHTFYLTLPIATLFALYCWSRFLTRRSWRRIAWACIVCGIIFHTGLAIYNFSHYSLYADRMRIVEAIQKRDFHIMGERRRDARY